MMNNKFANLSILITLFSSCVFAKNIPLKIEQSHFIEENMMKNYTIVQKPSLILIGIECRTSNAPDAGPQDIPKHWGKFYSEGIIGQIPNKISEEVIALYCDYKGDYTQQYSLVIGCLVNSLDIVPKGMVAKIIPVGAYAIFRAIGEHPKSLIETWGNIWQDDELKRTYSGDYELYGDKFSSNPQEVEVYIAIEGESPHDDR
jgi:predicted transcriptional regulator YdeE